MLLKSNIASFSITNYKTEAALQSLRVPLVEEVEKWEDRKRWEDGKVGG